MATPQSIRYLNETRVLDLLLKLGAMSRAEIARRAGLNRSSMGSIIASLIENDLVRERSQASANGQVGRPGIAVEINPDGGAFIGIEIGIERLSACAVNLNSEVICTCAMAFDTAHSPVSATLKSLFRLLKDTVKQAGIRATLRGVGVALPALTNDDGEVLNGMVLRWHDVPLRRLLLEQIDGVIGHELEVMVENDANAFAIAETWRNPELLTGTVAFLLMENGVGGSISHDGRLFRGNGGHAGEFGHLLVNNTTPVRSPPRHLENHVGKDAVLAQYRTAISNPAIEFDEIMAAIERAEPAALKTAYAWGQTMSQALTQISTILNPRRIILGGSVAALFPPMAAEITTRLGHELIDGFTLPEIQMSLLGAESTALGAALMMHRHFFTLDEGVLNGARLSA